MLEMIGTLFCVTLVALSWGVLKKEKGPVETSFPPPPPPPLQEEKKGPVLRINALSFWNHSWTQLNSNRSIQICSLTFFQLWGTICRDEFGPT